MSLSNNYILVTGGIGFIGSHTVVQLLQDNKNVIIIDNECNSSPNAIPRINSIVKDNKIHAYYKIDLIDYESLKNIIDQYKNKISCVIHFAGLKAVGESVKYPLTYHHNNISGTINLLRVMNENNIKQIIFSSSATVYGEPQKLPLTEDTPTNITNPYGRTKLIIEDIIKDTCESDSEWNAIILRYFNPVGAHKSGLIGEVTKGIPNNLLPYVAQVCTGKRPVLYVFGNDYNTKDGTGVRDYIHVEDLAQGHICALNYLENNNHTGYKIYNLGTGNGYSVLEVVNAMKEASGKDIPLEFKERRKGDIASCWADSSLAKKELKWEAKYNLKQMCNDLWNFQSQNPNGYED